MIFFSLLHISVTPDRSREFKHTSTNIKNNTNSIFCTTRSNSFPLHNYILFSLQHKACLTLKNFNVCTFKKKKEPLDAGTDIVIHRYLLLVMFTEFHHAVPVTRAMLWNVHKTYGKRRLNRSVVAVGTRIFTFGGYWYGSDQKISTHVLDTGKPLISFAYETPRVRTIM